MDSTLPPSPYPELTPEQYKELVDALPGLTYTAFGQDMLLQFDAEQKEGDEE